jgi:thymidine kinase
MSQMMTKIAHMNDYTQGNKMRQTDPQLIIFTGPMFGSKTTKMLAAIDRYRYQNQRIAAFKPIMDDRYSSLEIKTHSGGCIPAVGVNTGEDILQHVYEKQLGEVDVVAVDEAFMIEGSAEALLDLFRRGKTIVVSSLQLSASGNVFEEIRDIMPWATKIEVCPAVCPITGRDAYYTHRKLDGLEEIAVGGADMYEPRCWEHHSYVNQED